MSHSRGACLLGPGTRERCSAVLAQFCRGCRTRPARRPVPSNVYQLFFPLRRAVHTPACAIEGPLTDRGRPRPRPLARSSSGAWRRARAEPIFIAAVFYKYKRVSRTVPRSRGTAPTENGPPQPKVPRAHPNDESAVGLVPAGMVSDFSRRGCFPPPSPRWRPRSKFRSIILLLK